jgi:hypothetical protein
VERLHCPMYSGSSAQCARASCTHSIEQGWKGGVDGLPLSRPRQTGAWARRVSHREAAGPLRKTSQHRFRAVAESMTMRHPRNAIVRPWATGVGRPPASRRHGADGQEQGASARRALVPRACDFGWILVWRGVAAAVHVIGGDPGPACWFREGSASPRRRHAVPGRPTAWGTVVVGFARTCSRPCEKFSILARSAAGIEDVGERDVPARIA